MPDRTRPIRKEICLNEQELSVVRHKMNQLGTRNFGAYARKMLIDGYIIKVDYTEQKKLAAAVSRITTNINHVCRRIFDRILEVCVPIMFDGDSFRKSTAADNLKRAARLLG